MSPREPGDETIFASKVADAMAKRGERPGESVNLWTPQAITTIIITIGGLVTGSSIATDKIGGGEATRAASESAITVISENASSAIESAREIRDSAIAERDRAIARLDVCAVKYDACITARLARLNAEASFEDDEGDWVIVEEYDEDLESTDDEELAPY